MCRPFRSVPVHLTNTDFKIHNIMISDENIIVFDWEKIKNNFPLFWMASSFVRSFEQIADNWFISSNSIKKSIKIFLREYKATTPFSTKVECFPIIRSFEIITFLAEYTDGQKYISYKHRHLLDILSNILKLDIKCVTIK